MTNYNTEEVVVDTSANEKEVLQSTQNKFASISANINTMTADNPSPSPTAEEPTPTLAQTNRNIQVGIVADDYTNSNGSIQNLEKQLGRKFNSVSIYKQFGLESNKFLSQTNLAHLYEKKLVVAWEPWNPNEGMNQSKDYLAEITSGVHDGYIRAFAQEIKNYPNVVYLRFGHEMNGNWYPWGNRPNEYISAYKHVVDIFRSEGVSNIRFVWNINHESVPYESISSTGKYYPGDAYVDLVAIDGFNFGDTRSTGWKSFKEIFSSSYNYLVSNYNKPIFIAEYASAESGGDKKEWIKDMFYILDNEFTSINEIIWFNLIKETDWRIDSSTPSINEFRDNLQ